jgi:hypothetical protein
MNAIGILILFVIIMVVSFAPRRWAMLGMMAGALYLTQGQQAVVFGFNLFAIRFVELAGFIRVVIRREFYFSRLNGIDRALLLLYIYTTIVFLLRSSESQAYQIGMAVDAFLCYFTFRGLIGGVEDFIWFLRAFIILLAPYVLLVLVESMTRYNPFSVMGGVNFGDVLREGRLRCQGSFRNPSLLGTLGASFFPLYIGLAGAKIDQKLAFFGIALCLLIVWASNSGGPASCTVVGVIGWLLWRVRTKMHLVRRGVATIVVALAIVMKAPIWYLLARISSITGGDGWHRSYLLDVAFRNIDKWWLAGMSIRETKDWFPYDLAATGAADITNQFLSFGLAGGLAAMILFLVLLIFAFKRLGRALAAVRSNLSTPDGSEYLLWGLGVMLAAHISNWLGITYFDQTYVIWFMQLAAISNLSEICINAFGHETTADAAAPTQTNKDQPLAAQA